MNTNTNTTLSAPRRPSSSLSALLALPLSILATTSLGCASPTGSGTLEDEEIGAAQEAFSTRAGYRPLRVVHSNKCVDVYEAGMANLAPLIQFDCGAQANQGFKFIRVSTGYAIQALHSGKCLDVTGGSTDRGAPIIQYDCVLGASNQTFVPVWQSDGSYMLKAVHSNMCLDVHSASTANGATLIQWDCGGGANQRFRAGDNIYDALARRYAPSVWLHSADYYRPSSVDFFLANVHEEPTPDGPFLVTNQPLGCATCTDPVFLDGQNPASVPVYAEIVHRTHDQAGQNVSDVIYWMFYPYNAGKDALGTNVGNHVGDWEHFTIRFINGAPNEVYLAQHGSGVSFGFWDQEVMHEADGRPIIFSAKGSHALYEYAGSFDYNYDMSTDYTDWGLKWETRNNVVSFTKDESRADMPWLDYLGRWGNPEGGTCFDLWLLGRTCQLEDGPESIFTREITDPEFWELK